MMLQIKTLKMCQTFKYQFYLLSLTSIKKEFFFFKAIDDTVYFNGFFHSNSNLISFDYEIMIKNHCNFYIFLGIL